MEHSTIKFESAKFSRGASMSLHTFKHALTIAQGSGVNGSNATCATLSEGGITFTSRGANVSHYQPFANATSISLWARHGNGSEHASDASLLSESPTTTPNSARAPAPLPPSIELTVQCLTIRFLEK